MAIIKPFKAIRPQVDLAKIVATLPYDVSTVEEIQPFQHEPLHFYHVTRSEIDIPNLTDVHANIVYETAAKNLSKLIDDQILFLDQDDAYYIYEMEMHNRVQTGLVCAASIKDYLDNKIKKHEYTRPDKVNDRIKHIEYTAAQTGIIFLAYKDVDTINKVITNWKENHENLYNFIAEDGIRHTVWKINDAEIICKLTQSFEKDVPETYIADGHHRTAAIAAIAEKNNAIDSTYVLSCIFPASQLSIFDYNRIVTTLNGLSKAEFLDKLSNDFDIRKVNKLNRRPSFDKEFGLYIDGEWYKLTAKNGTYDEQDPIASLDVSILQDNIMSKILGIHDSRTDNRIDFVGGIRGLDILEKIVDGGKAIAAFACYPVHIQQLFQVADTDNVMPPKSTWFEPKTRDGLIVYDIHQS